MHRSLLPPTPLENRPYSPTTCPKTWRACAKRVLRGPSVRPSTHSHRSLRAAAAASSVVVGSKDTHSTSNGLQSPRNCKIVKKN